MTATTAADQRRILDIASRMAQAGRDIRTGQWLDVGASDGDRTFMRSHSWQIWTAISELRSGKPVSQPTQTTASPSARKTTVDITPDRTTIIIDDDPADDGDGAPSRTDPTDPGDDLGDDLDDDAPPAYGKGDGTDDDPECDPSDPSDDDCDVVDDD